MLNETTNAILDAANAEYVWAPAGAVESLPFVSDADAAHAEWHALVEDERWSAEWTARETGRTVREEAERSARREIESRYRDCEKDGHLFRDMYKSGGGEWVECVGHECDLTEFWED